MSFGQELAIEAVQMRVADLQHTITTRLGVSDTARAANQAIAKAVAPVIAAIMARND